jgi:hypothetical protein
VGEIVNARAAESRVSELIVSLALGWVGKDFVGFSGFLKATFRIRVGIIAIRVVLVCGAAIRLLELLGRHLPRYAQNLVIISLGFCRHGHTSRVQSEPQPAGSGVGIRRALAFRCTSLSLRALIRASEVSSLFRSMQRADARRPPSSCEFIYKRLRSYRMA